MVRILKDQFFSRSKFFFIFLSTHLCLLSNLAAHQVEQFYADYDEAVGTFTIQFDVAYAMPETRDDPDAPQPKHSWLNELPLEQHTLLKQEAENYLRQYLTLYSKKQPIGLDLIFPDFNTSPPSFISLLNQGAYYRIEIRPKKDIENVSISIIQDEAPDLLIAHKPFKSAEVKYQTLQPGMTYTFPSSRNLNNDSQATLSKDEICLLYTSPSPRDKRQSRMPSSA